MDDLAVHVGVFLSNLGIFQAKFRFVKGWGTFLGCIGDEILPNYMFFHKSTASSHVIFGGLRFFVQTPSVSFREGRP